MGLMNELMIDKMNEEVESDAQILQSKKELLQCIQNLMGVFDTPVARLRIQGEFVDEVRKIGREILASNFPDNG